MVVCKKHFAFPYFLSHNFVSSWLIQTIFFEKQNIKMKLYNVAIVILAAASAIGGADAAGVSWVSAGRRVCRWKSTAWFACSTLFGRWFPLESFASCWLCLLSIMLMWYCSCFLSCYFVLARQRSNLLPCNVTTGQSNQDGRHREWQVLGK